MNSLLQAGLRTLLRNYSFPSRDGSNVSVPLKVEREKEGVEAHDRLVPISQQVLPLS